MTTNDISEPPQPQPAERRRRQRRNPKWEPRFKPVVKLKVEDLQRACEAWDMQLPNDEQTPETLQILTEILFKGNVDLQQAFVLQYAHNFLFSAIQRLLGQLGCGLIAFKFGRGAQPPIEAHLRKGLTKPLHRFPEWLNDYVVLKPYQALEIIHDSPAHSCPPCSPISSSSLHTTAHAVNHAAPCEGEGQPAA
ncbi:hypothetical protein P153DRAFT_371508 [Dothidotthia symphoricarpi CBS 119687]|uniref:Uncharacterized protein n=1 Tax=Dothidotthia symphoricarpi CBS 119687 TaxID=1392245 RepID=A0A6A5ZZ58_9PLEO|nr:uncharacterized protein P153DRAFT_371508 [Dothidotthia symphoricarpi CBS 119687]KAF2123698.1 hypothetical protein P153DRAFT_371508 [Dothidotthia symphoricarpi CBS 119687]